MSIKSVIPLLGIALAVVACHRASDDNAGTVVVDTVTRVDTVFVIKQDLGVRTVTGVAIDGGMNSIDLLVGNDTLSFEYPELATPVKWIDGDTMTVVLSLKSDSVLNVIHGTSG